MIRIFFSENGYYVIGEGIESVRRCVPATTERGDRIFSPIHHTYKILALALLDVIKRQIKEDVIVFNDSRIIDEINCLSEPLDDTCQKWLVALRRSVIPNVPSVVFFRKKPSCYINEVITEAHTRLLTKLSEHDKQNLFDIYKKQTLEKEKSRKRNAIAKLRERWFEHGK